VGASTQENMCALKHMHAQQRNVHMFLKNPSWKVCGGDSMSTKVVGLVMHAHVPLHLVATFLSINFFCTPLDK
jgi:hypothetical protein